MGDLNTLSLADLYRELESTGLIRRLLELARDEDLGPGRLDVSSQASVSPEARTEALLVARAPGTIAALRILPTLLDVYGSDIGLDTMVQDGDRVAAGTTVARLSGSKREILAVERPMLNLVGHLSGVATMAAAFVAAVGAGPQAKVYDTRKTIPGLRVLEKYAVRCGGAHCHRIGLFDAVLMKDNHLAGVGLDSLAKFIAAAARKARKGGGIVPETGVNPAFVEVEVDSLDQFARVLTIDPGLVDIVLLDNMTPIQLRQAVGMRDRAKSAIELEASGGVRLDTIRAIAETGVERISVGAITHSAAWLDVALDIRE